MIPANINIAKTLSILNNYYFSNENPAILCVKNGKNGKHLTTISGASICWHSFLNIFGCGKQFHLADISNHLVDVLKTGNINQLNIDTTRQQFEEVSARADAKAMHALSQELHDFDNAASNTPLTPIERFFSRFANAFTYNPQLGITNCVRLNWHRLTPLARNDPSLGQMFANFQHELRQQTSQLLRAMGFQVSRKGFIKGINVANASQISATKAKLRNNMRTEQQTIKQLFYTLSCAGMHGYADRIRTSLAGLGIQASLIPNSVPLDVDWRNASENEVHEDIWTQACRQGHNDYVTHYINKNMPANTTLHASTQAPMPVPISEIQELEYQNRRKRIHQLHAEGRLLVRNLGRDTQELHSPAGIYSGFWHLKSGTNLSTTLLPQAGSPINMRLFAGGKRAVLIDPDVIHPDYFGNGFNRNAGTQHDNFQKDLKTRRDGMPLAEVRKTLAQESAQASVNLSNSTRGHTEIAYFRPAERNLVTGLFFTVGAGDCAPLLREHIELQHTLRLKYGIFLPIFAYNNKKFQEVVVTEHTLKALGIQNFGIALRTLSDKEIAAQKAHPERFFQLYRELNTPMVIAAQKKMAALPDIGTEHQTHADNFLTLFNIQLRLLHAKYPTQRLKVEYSATLDLATFIQDYLQEYTGDKAALIEDLRDCDPASLAPRLAEKTGFDQDILADLLSDYQASLAGKRVRTKLKMIRNMHLIFPSIFPTKHHALETVANDLFFSHSALTRYLLGTPELSEFWIQMAKRNMRVFLGIEIDVDHEDSVTDVRLDDIFDIESLFDPAGRDHNTRKKKQAHMYASGSDSEDDGITPLSDPQANINTKAMVQYAHCTDRLVRMLHLLGKAHWAQAITQELLRAYGNDFGILGDPNSDIDDEFQDQGTAQFLNNLKSSDFEKITPLPQGSSLTLRAYNKPRQFSDYLPKSPIKQSKRTAPSAQSNQYYDRYAPLLTGAPKANPTASKYKALAIALDQLYTDTWGDNYPKLQQQVNALDTCTAFRVQANFIDRGNTRYPQELIPELVGSKAKKLHAEHAFANLRADASTVKVFYHQTDNVKDLVIPNLITQTAVRTKGGDTNLLLPNGSDQLQPLNAQRFLDNESRRIKRRTLVTTGRITVTANGGYKSKRTTLARKTHAWFITTMAPNFEKYQQHSGDLEVSEFIVQQHAKQNDNPFFPLDHENGILPSYHDLNQIWGRTEEAITLLRAKGAKRTVESLRSLGLQIIILEEDDPHSLEADVIRLRNGDFYLLADFKKSTKNYFTDLVLPAIERTLYSAADPTPIYLKATAFGSGVNSAVGIVRMRSFQTSLHKYIIKTHLDTYEALIKEGSIPRNCHRLPRLWARFGPCKPKGCSTTSRSWACLEKK